MGSPWWRDAVFYEIYLRSFADSDADGIGDLAGISSRLPYLADLGVDALWLTPFYPSPLADGGYDVADYREVDPAYGDLAAFDELLAAAHRLGLRLIVDVVPNHTSDRHRWFQAALAGEPGGPERARYLFRDGSGDRPPNNWQSVFGGPAWSREPRTGQWYLHLFSAGQPDLDWRQPAVAAEFLDILRFWLDRGVDGFRIDVAHGLVKAAELPDLPAGRAPDLLAETRQDDPMYDQPEVHEIYRTWHDLLAGYPGDRMAIGEVWLGDPVAVSRYLRADELQQAFNFRFLSAPWSAAAFRRVVEASLAATEAVGATATWTLSNHDVARHVSRYGGGRTGRRRARAALLLLLALPGSAYLYQGEELGLPEAPVPGDARRDPIWRSSAGTERGRDGARVPVPWSGTAPPYGFTVGPRSWLPAPAGWAELTVAAQTGDPTSVLSLYRRALRLRRWLPALGAGPLEWCAAGEDQLVFRRPDEAGRQLCCAVNLGGQPAELPPGEVLLASCPRAELAGGILPADSAAWIRP